MRQDKFTRKLGPKWLAYYLLLAAAGLSGCKEDDRAFQGLNHQIAESEKRLQTVEHEFQAQVQIFESQVVAMKEAASAQQLHIDHLKNEMDVLKVLTEGLKSELARVVERKIAEDENAKYGAIEALIENICTELTRMLNEPIKFRYGDGFQAVTNERDRLNSFISDRQLELNKLVAELERQGYPRWEELKKEVQKCVGSFSLSISTESLSATKAAAGNLTTANHDLVEFLAMRKKARESVTLVRGFKASVRK